MSPAPTPRRHVLADGTYDSIRAMIVDHVISPGQHVGIDELARDLGVSQTPVREALARLEADGLVTKIPLRGYEATDLLSVQQFDDLFQFRGIIEPWAASEAARRGSRRELEALDAELARAEGISRSGGASTYPEFVEHDTRFHALVARASGSRYVEDAFIHTHCHMHLLRVYRASEADDTGFVQDMFAEYYSGGKRPLALAEHGEIASAIARGDGAAARDLMLGHIESSRQRFIPAVEALNARA
ncbi:MAG: GntR family transcriptional regulator [Microbacteriaceae bacterium]|nr:GntR family transcriptional regulator [Microbacteriaceae bacterium]